MPFDRFLIAPINTGLQTNLRPWLIPDDAFASLQNAYVFRGRVRKRFGSVLMGLTPLLSRLRINIGTTNAGTGNFTATVPGNVFGIGQMFSIGAEIFTVYQTGTPANMLDTGAATLATYDTTTGAVVIHGAAKGAIVYFYPATPVMGFTQYDIGLINNHPSYAFDTQFVYLWSNATGWGRSGTALWHGSDLNFFWSDNWQGAAGDTVLFTTNFNATTGAAQPSVTDDPIWYTTDGATWTAALGSSVNGFFFLPAGGAVHTGPFVQTARIIVAYKNRLVFLNTIENDNSLTGGSGTATNYPNRCRFSFNGSPLARNAWYEPNQMDTSGGVVNNNNIAAGAGFIDAPTEEQIISAEFIKDRLIVYFERSTWELAYTGSEILPFIWNKLNTELGSQSTFSTVPFDREVYTIGNTGIHICNGSNVVRIDNKIPDEIFDFQTQTQNGGTLRTWGIRDYYTENIYWTFVLENATPTQTFPNQILVYNYRNGSWALNDDCFTAFGYFEQQQDTTWASSFPVTWAQSNETWESGVIAANQRQIIVGTPEGFVLRIAPDVSRNAPSMQITNMIIPSTVYGAEFVDLEVVNHNVAVEDYVAVENTNGITLPILGIYQVIKINPNGTDPNLITIYAPDIAGTYTGGGTLARVSKIEILTKQYNPYVEDDRNVYIHKVDFGVKRTESGQITVDYYPSSTELSMINAGTQTNTIMGTSVLETSPYDVILYPLEQFQDRLWHPLYFQTSGECIQLYLYFTDAQMSLPSIVWDDFELEGMVLYTSPTSQRLQ